MTEILINPVLVDINIEQNQTEIKVINSDISIDNNSPFINVLPPSSIISLNLPDLIIAGIYGAANLTTILSVDSKGRIENIETIPILFPVTSVNNKEGVINLTTLDIPENTNLYYSNERVKENTITDMAIPNQSLNMNNQRIINVANPVDQNDGVNKAYIDNVGNFGISLGLVIALG